MQNNVSYCLKGRKQTENKNLRVEKKKKRKPMLLSKCAVCKNKKSIFIKKQGASANN